MTLYCLVADGEIVDGPKPLPKSWRNVSGLDLLPTEELAKMGWLPVEDSKATIDPTMEKATPPELSIGDGKVTRSFGKAALSTEEIAERGAINVRTAAPPEEIQEALLKEFERQAAAGATLHEDLAAILAKRANARK